VEQRHDALPRTTWPQIRTARLGVAVAVSVIISDGAAGEVGMAAQLLEASTGSPRLTMR